MTQPFTPDELQTLRDACKKRIDRAEQKIKYWNANPDKPQQPGLIFTENTRIKKLNQLVAKIDFNASQLTNFERSRHDGSNHNAITR